MRKQRSDFENLQIASKYFLRKLGAKVTSQTIDRSLTSHPAFPSILALSETLSDLNIENMAVNIGSDRLDEVPFPAVAHFTKGHFVVLDNFKNNQVTYFDPAEGHITQALDEFENEWSGVLLMAELDEKSGEKDFNLKRLQFPAVISILVLTLIVGVITGLKNYPAETIATWLPLLGLKIIGGITAVLLIFKEEGINNTLLHKVCDTEANTKISCGQVLDSPAAKLFGWLKMSDLGLVYFAGGSIVLLASLSIGSLVSTMLYLGVFTVLALPYTLFSIAYQAFVIKKWCVLCLTVQLVFWLEFLVSFSLLKNGWSFFHWTSVGSVILGFGVVAAFWMLMKPNLRWKKELLEQETKLNYFLKNEQIMQALIEASPQALAINFTDKVILGNPDSPMEVTMVSNVYCQPCAKKHENLEELLSTMPDVLRVNVLFTGHKDQNDKINVVSRHLAGLHYEYNPEECMEATSFWYKHHDKEGLVKKYPLSEDSLARAKELHEQHINWIKTEDISGTPTILVEGRVLPVGFDLDNFKWYWRSMAMAQEG